MRFTWACITALLIGAQLLIVAPAGSQPTDSPSRPPPGAAPFGSSEGDPASVLEAQTHLNTLGYEPGMREFDSSWRRQSIGLPAGTGERLLSA